MVNWIVLLPRIFYATVWVVIHAVVFGITYSKYKNSPEFSTVRSVMGESLFVSRASAACINLDIGFLLFPVCRNLISVVRGTFLNRIVPFDKNLRFHKIVAWTMMLFAITHTAGHYFNLQRVERASFMTELSGAAPPTNGTFFIPAGITTFKLAFTVTSLTGHALLLIMLLMFTSALEAVRRKYFEMFWFTHHLFVLWFAILPFHSSSCLIKTNDGQCVPPQAWIWMLPGLVTYLLERIYREIRARQPTYISKVVLHPSKVVEIQWKKPSMATKPGQYIFINIPEVSRLEWHPFTLTSAPEEDYHSIHMRVVGDWTNKVAVRLGALPGPNGKTGATALPRVLIDGPFGTASEDVFKYEVAMLVGAGIGVTPFASILKSIWFQKINPAIMLKLQKVYFVWTCRDKDAFEWFQDLLEALESEDFDNFLDIHSYLTGSLKANELHNVIVNDDDVYDPVTRLRARTNYGRPNFNQLCAMIRERHGRSHAKTKVGVFFCGPAVLGQQIRKACNSATSADCVFDFHKENF